jgi:hypothetical protein
VNRIAAYFRMGMIWNPESWPRSGCFGCQLLCDVLVAFEVKLGVPPPPCPAEGGGGRIGRARPPDFQSAKLKVDLKAALHNSPRGSSADYFPKGSSTGGVGTRQGKVGRVERVEHLPPKFNSIAFLKVDLLVNSNIRVG